MVNIVFEIIKTVEKTGKAENNIPPTFLYNEGWLLRIILRWFHQHQGILHKLTMNEGTFWFSEALLSSNFFPKFRGDKLAESYTHADAAYGDIKIGGNGVGDLVLKDNCKQFGVIEAKLFTKYSKGITNAKNYNQAARTVACMCNVLVNSKQNVDDILFYTIIPKDHIRRDEFEKYQNIRHIKQTVLDRVEQYKNQSRDEEYSEKREWYDNKFLPFCDLLKQDLLYWENIIEDVKSFDKKYGEKIETFYENCKKYSTSSYQK
jgi:hypothetical protein